MKKRTSSGAETPLRPVGRPKRAPTPSAPPKTRRVQIKTRETAASVKDFIARLDNAQQRRDSEALVTMMQRASGEPPKMWGEAIIGFGNRLCTSPKTGRQVEWLRIGFAPRKSSISLYLTMEINRHGPILRSLGAHKTGVGCLYIKTLTDVNVDVLKRLIETALKESGT